MSSSENDRATFSLRLPIQLAHQIDARAKVNNRTRNAEVVTLLTQGLDICVQRDLRILQDMRNHPHVDSVTVELGSSSPKANSPE